ncbi:MAG: Smr/MutS family protein, partial [Butyrivibrio sp.]|nr:Smr/MutS family protein [Butyrivibrio sp.]
AEASPAPAPSRGHTGRVKMSKALNISPEINLLGKTVDEALAELDKYLDDAYLSRLSTVRVVHGKGSGVLRNAVHNFLRRQKHVKSFRLGSFGEGDYGVTIVEFKE